MLTDLRPLKESPDFRRLWIGQTVSQLGQQMTAITIAYQVYIVTGSSFAVGLVGLYSVVPLVLGGLYGGALVDAFDRRKVAIATAAGLWLCSGLLVWQAWRGWESVGLLYVVVAVQSALFAVNNPARQAILPRIVPRELLPATNALTMASFNLGFTLGPLLGGVIIAWHGVDAAYAVDALTFILDLFAMVLAQPRALFPALALTVYAGNASTLGVLQAAPAIGSLIAFVLSGWISHVHRHGIAIAVAIVAYGASVMAAGFSAIGLPGMLTLVVVFLALSGASDMVSAAYRSTMLQSAAPDQLRGRVQGVFTVVVAGGPRLGDFVAGSVASLTSEGTAMVLGGMACMAGVVLTTMRARRFRAYDARAPEL